MSFKNGNKADGKHYWLTPLDLMDDIKSEFDIDYDPCPFPLSEGFNGLKTEWGQSNYVNPPFGSYTDERGKKFSPTAWVKKSIHEYRKGKKVVFVYPIDKWVLMMIQAGAEIRNLKDVKWRATEDGSTGPGTGRHVAMFILNPETNPPKEIIKSQIEINF